VHHDIRQTLETMLVQLEKCQKALSDFLEEKRSAFPRFYFIGDDDLLEILGQAKNPWVIQSHLNKLFQGVANVHFNDAGTEIEAMVSGDGELVSLDDKVTISESVEEWLALFTEEMKSTLSASLASYLSNLESNGHADFEVYSSQVLCLGELVRFSDNVEASFARGFAEMQSRARSQLEAYTKQDLTDLQIMQHKVKSLVMDLIHNADVLRQLSCAGCRDPDDWVWRKQLRYYVDDKSLATIHMSDAAFPYSYEYQGNAGKLVHTPLTDKCYLTLVQGMHMGFGGNPYGPAGTGKTESVKALGGAFGRQVLVFNCFDETHQLLTNRGFLFLDEVKAYIGDDLLFATYDKVSKNMLYVPKAKLFECVEVNGIMVGFMHHDKIKWRSGVQVCAAAMSSVEQVSLLVTPNHQMYVKDYPRTEGYSVDDKQNETGKCCFAKTNATRLTQHQTSFQFLTHAPEGLLVSMDSFATRAITAAFESLGIDLNKEIVALSFLEFYGFWLQSCSTNCYEDKKPRTICCCQTKQSQVHLLSRRVHVLNEKSAITSKARYLDIKDRLYLWFFTAKYHNVVSSSSSQPGDPKIPTPGWSSCFAITHNCYASGPDVSLSAQIPSDCSDLTDRRQGVVCREFVTRFTNSSNNAEAKFVLVEHFHNNTDYSQTCIHEAQHDSASSMSTKVQEQRTITTKQNKIAALTTKIISSPNFRHFDIERGGTLSEISTTIPCERIHPACCHFKLTQWMPWWVFCIKTKYAGAVISGICYAGSSDARSPKTVKITDRRFCDQFEHLAYHAGYSVSLALENLARHGSLTCWSVTCAAKSCSSRYMKSDRNSDAGYSEVSDVKVVRYTGRTWCVRIQTYRFVIVRRAKRDNRGYIIHASTPTIQGNCDEGIDFHSMGRIFIGLVKCGAWGCFDEFNRLKEDQLSAISQQIQVIQDAIKTKSPVLSLLGREVDVDFDAGIFVTLNPAGKDYGGRSQIPDNLKALFRPVAMGRPDNELIAEVYLQAEGFTQARDLAVKIVSLFSLSKQLLTRQRHYDWGLRALKAVLKTGGKLVLQERSSEEVSVEIEAVLLIKAVRVNTLSKLTFGDTSRFLALIGDVFPGVESSDIAGGELEATIREVMQSKAFSLSIDETQIRKMLQLKEALDQRMGCVVVGPSGCGKSTVWRVLQSALIKRGQTVKTHVMNPKSMPRQQLLGEMDLDTREWSDGVLTAAARKVVKEPREVQSWIVCDGDVDPEWIESLNSVLDDNHLLTLPNGERISFGNNVNFLFETHDLRFASPATISRMGMIFLSDEDIEAKRVVSKWLLSQNGSIRQRLEAWLDDFFYRALKYVTGLQSFVVDTTLVGTILNGLASITGVSTKLAFLVRLIHGLGGNLSITDRSSFAKEVFAWAGERPPDVAAPLDCDADETGQRLLSFQTDSRGTVHENDVLTLNSVVDTVSTRRIMAQLKPWVQAAEPFILVGNEGCGKSLMIRHVFAQKRKIAVATLSCSAQTKAAHVIAKIGQCCSLFSAPDGRVYRPRDCERLVLYLKDLNLPKPDVYDTSMLIAFLQQLLTFGGFYDANLEFLRIERIQFVASMNPATTVGRHVLSTRFTATVRICYLDYPDTQELTIIYGKILEVALQQAISAGGEKVAANLADFLSVPDRMKLAGTLVEIYDKIRATFLLNDARHYLFTPRDLSAWVENLSRYDLAREDLLNVVAYEGSRLFRDRMVDRVSEEKLDVLMSAILRSRCCFVPALDGVYFTTLGSKPIGANTRDHRGNNNTNDAEKLVRVDASELKALLQKGIGYYEQENVELHMLIFSQILDQISRVDRVLSSSEGNLLLIGRSGVGRRTTTKLVSYMHGYKFQSPSLVHSTGDEAMKHFRLELKPVLQTITLEGCKAVFYVEDHHFNCGAVLELLNSLISSGEAPGLYSNDELESLLSQLREAMIDEASCLTPYDFFVARVRRLLHICVAMDPTNDKFRVRTESNPALFSRCTILWMGDWCKSSMRTVPMMIAGVSELLLGGVNTTSEIAGSPSQYDHASEHKSVESKTKHRSEGKAGQKEKDGRVPRTQTIPKDRGLNSKDLDENLLGAVIAIHITAKKASPRDFMLFLENWKRLHERMQGDIQTKLKHLSAGLEKLDEASVTVDSLSNHAEEEQAKLQKAQKGADAAMEMITQTLSEATGRRAEVHELQGEIIEKEEHTIKRQGEIKQELSSIQPVLETAKAAVGQIKAEHLNEIRSLKMPPEPIADVLGAVLKLLGISDVSWTSMKKFLSNRGVKDEILNYDARRIGGDMRKDVARLLKQKSSSFDQATITRVSVAAAPLAAWVKANIRYSVVLEKIQPLENELSKAEDSLAKCNQRLTHCKEEISAIDDRVSALKAQFGERTREAEKLRARLVMAEGTLDKAQCLLAKLSGEKTRWQTQMKELHLEQVSLPRRLLLAAGFLTYLSRYPEDIRETETNNWKELVDVVNFSFTRLLSTESQLLAWKQMGLPTDSLSRENALVIVHNPHHRVPFIIDPADAARQWLQTHYGEDKGRSLELVQSADPRFTSRVELAVRFGKTLLIFDVDTLEPMLYPLAREDIMMQGPRCVVHLGDKLLDYNSNFRLVLVTRNPRPDLQPDASALCTSVNFTVTRSGLEGQLLGTTIQHEQPELEIKKNQMLREEEDYKIKLAALERKLLEALATAEGDLLENTLLIDSLSQTKEASKEIQDALSASAEASVELNKQREAYRGFSSDGSRLYFLVRDLVAVNNMYQFSLASFVKLFRKALQDDSSDGSDSLPERLSRLTPLLERLVFFFVGRGMFKADRCMFSLQIIHGMHREEFGAKEWELFTGELSGERADLEEQPRSNLPSWAGIDRGAAFSQMNLHLGTLVHALDVFNKARWSRWARSSECEREFPREVLRECTPFQRVLTTWCFRPDRLMSALQAFACEVLQIPSLSPQSLSLDQLYHQETEAKVPTLLITTPGADPSKELADFAMEFVGTGRYKSLAMGGGTHDQALTSLQEASADGTWLCFQNLHLVVAWLPTLEKALAALKAHEHFRLWLTTEPHRTFPRILLQHSLKVTFESPPGTKKNMQRTLSTWGRDFFEKGGSGRRSELLFCLAWFHAILQERRTYIPQGWTKSYEFSVGDLRAGAFVMDAMAVAASKSTSLDLELIRGLMQDAIYGGRVDNLYDERVLKAYLRIFISRDVIEGQRPLSRTLPFPRPCSYEAALTAVSNLGDQDDPALFGLPVNIGRSVQRTASIRVSNQLRRLKVIEHESLTFDREIWSSKLMPLLDQWQLLTEDSPVLNGRFSLAEHNDTESSDPIAGFVAMEDRMSNMIEHEVSLCLDSLKKVVYGTVLLTPHINAVGSSLMMGEIPGSWRTNWDGPEKPSVWLNFFARKAVAIKRWRGKACLQRLSDFF